MASSYVGGLSGAFIPVSEDQGMIDAVNAGSLTLEKLEAMTCVCSVGLDMIAIPGETKAETISGIIADEMAIGMINRGSYGYGTYAIIDTEPFNVIFYDNQDHHICNQEVLNEGMQLLKEFKKLVKNIK